MLFLPISYIVFKFGAAAYSSMIVLCLIYFIAMFFRVCFLKRILHLNKKDYFLNVIKPLIPAMAISLFVLSLVHHCVSFDAVWYKILQLFTDFLFVGVTILVVGLSKNERMMVKNLITNKFKKNGR